MSLDRLSNMLSALKNASMAKKVKIEVIYSKECESVAKVLKKQSILQDVKVFKPREKPHKMISLTLNREGESFALNDLKRISKPGRRVYSSSKGLRTLAGSHEIVILSTSRGIMDRVDAQKKNLGGEVICRAH